MTTAGDTPYASAANVIARLAKGTAYQIKRMNAAATAPEWGNPASEPLDVVTVDTEVVNTVTETNLLSFSVAGGTLSTNNVLRIAGFYSYLNNSGVNADLTIRYKYGATTLITLPSLANENANASRQIGIFEALLKGDAATNAQRMLVSAWNRGADAVKVAEGTSAIDSTAAQNFVITNQHGTAAATISTIIRVSVIELLRNI